MKALSRRLCLPTKSVIISGDREWTCGKTIAHVLGMLSVGTQITHGACKGADLIAEKVALEFNASLNMRFDIRGLAADWKRYGKGAGPLRNQDMLNSAKADMVIAFHDNINESKGTKNMIMLANKANVPCYLITSMYKDTVT